MGLLRNPENLYCPDRWVGWWVGVKKAPFIFLKFEYGNKDVLIRNTAVKVMYGHYIKSCEQLMFQKLTKIMMATKDLPPRCKLKKDFKKYFDPKNLT